VTLSIVTPWHNCIELLGQYLAAVRGADQVIVIDNASDPQAAPALASLANIGATIIRNDENRLFSAACNQGLDVATGDVVLFLNNDVLASPKWLERVRADVQDGGLYGPTPQIAVVGGQPMTYLEGWCIAARRATWTALGGWDAEAFPLYTSDVDLCWRAYRAGYGMRVRRWAIQHLSNYTSSRTPGSYDGSAAARARFAERVARA